MALHQAAATVMEKVLAKKSSLKSGVYESEWRSKSVLTAVVTETLKFKDALEEIVEVTALRKKEKLFVKLEKSWLLHVLLYELLVGKGLKGKTLYEKALLKYKTLLAAEWARLKIRRKVMSDAELAIQTSMVNDDTVAEKSSTKEAGDEGIEKDHPHRNKPSLPRYVRVNTIKASTVEVISNFKKRGFNLIETPSNFDDFHSRLTQLEARNFLRDFHMPDFLLVFPSGTSFHDCPLYKNGTLILQDKASCLPPYVLKPPPSARVIDACAAPGNKTTLLAAMMGNVGHVTAFDISAKRIKTMKQMTARAGALKTPHGDGCVVIQNVDFLSTNPDDDGLRETEYIVVDPSCSGSGIQNRLNHLTDDSSSSSSHRLLQLQDFQLRALTHALSFPRVKRVVYSTCSVHSEENEIVVVKALETSRAREWGFRLKDAMEGRWKTRGMDGEVGGSSKGGESEEAERITKLAAPSDSSWHLERCLRAAPATDLTNGFFVALFEREVKGGDENDTTEEEEEEEERVDNYEEALRNQSAKKRRKKEKKKRKLEANC